MMNVYKIESNCGLQVSLADFGARIIDIKLGDASVAMQYPKLDDYQLDRHYLGATIGPIANRLKGGTLTIAGQNYHLTANEGDNSLHGGTGGYDKAVWEVGRHSNSSIEFNLCINEQHNPLPGTLDLIAHYHVKDTQLRVDYSARSSHLNYLNLTNHVYLNLNSQEHDIRNHEYRVFANSFLIADQDGIPNGEAIEIQYPFDYSPSETCIHSELQGSVDHHFNCASDLASHKLHRLVEARSPESNISVVISSNKPGFQFYTGQYLNVPLQSYGGFCVEPQYAPNAPNDSRFFSPYCSAEKPYQHSICYQFDWPGTH